MKSGKDWIKGAFRVRLSQFRSPGWSVQAGNPGPIFG